MLLFHYVKLVSILYFLSAYCKSCMWHAFHMVGNRLTAPGTCLSILSSHPTDQQYHLGASGHSALLTSVKRTNISIDANTQIHTTQPRTMQQSYTGCTLGVGTSPWENLLLFSFQIKSWDFERYPFSCQKTVPGPLQINQFFKNLESEVCQRFTVDFCLIRTKGNNFPSLKPLSRSLNDWLPNLALAPSPPCLLFLHAIDVRPNLIPI